MAGIDINPYVRRTEYGVGSIVYVVGAGSQWVYPTSHRD